MPYNPFQDEELKSHSVREIAEFVKANDPDMADADLDELTAFGEEERRSADWQQGFFGDFIDSAQQGFTSMIRGDLETANLITDDEFTRAGADKIKAFEEENLAGMSTMAQEAMAKEFISDTEDGGWEFGDAWSDPRAYSNIIASGFGSLAGMFATGGPLKKGAQWLLKKGFHSSAEDLLKSGVAKNADEAAKMAAENLKKVDRAAGIAGYGTAEGAAIGGLTAADIAESYDQMDDQMKAEAPMFRGIYHANKEENPELSHEELWAKTDAEMRDSLRKEGAVMAGVPSAMLGAVFGPYMEKLVFRGAKSANRGTAALKGAAAEGIPEAGQGAVEQYAQNVQLGKVDPTIDPMSGVANAAVMEGIGGMGAGAPITAITADIQSSKTVEEAVAKAEAAAGRVSEKAAEQASRNQAAAIANIVGNPDAGLDTATPGTTPGIIPVPTDTEITSLSEQQEVIDATREATGNAMVGPVEEGAVPGESRSALQARRDERQNQRLKAELDQRMRNEEKASPEVQAQREAALEQWDDELTIDENLKNVPINSQMAKELEAAGLITKQQAEDAGIRFAASEAATSTENDRAEPTEGQKHAGNYKLGKTRVNGLDISIENPQGSTRSGTDTGGKAWSQTMTHHYGYIKGTVGKDKDHVDVFLGPKASDPAGTVFVVDQVVPGSNKFDEHKVMMGFDNEQEAVDAYLSNYEDGWEGLGSITAMPIEQFRSWVKDPVNTSRKASLRRFKGGPSEQMQQMRDSVEKQSETEKTTETAQAGTEQAAGASSDAEIKLSPATQKQKARTKQHKREKSSKRYVGAPDWVGSSPAKLERLYSKLRAMAVEGESGRYWYEKSSKAVLDFVGGDKKDAEKFVALLAIYSQGTEVNVNMGFALEAYYQWKAGLPINTGRFPKEQSKKAENILRNNKGWGGVKTNNFYTDLMEEIDPAKTDQEHATMDMWMAIAFDYGAKVLDQGPKYNFAKDVTINIAEDLGWKPHQVQAAIWTAIKTRVEATGKQRDAIEKRRGIDPSNAKDREKGTYAHFRLAHKLGADLDITPEEIAEKGFDFSDTLNQRAAQMSWEATPSVTAGDLPGIHNATTEQKFEYLTAIQKALTGKDGEDLIAKLLNLHTPPTFNGYSAWEGAIGAGAQSIIPVPVKGTAGKRAVNKDVADTLNLYSALRGLIMHQDAVVWHHPIYADAKSRHNGFELRMTRPGTEAETEQFYKAIHDKFGTWDLAPGYTQAGYRVLNFVQGLSNKDFQKGMNEVLESLPDEFGGGALVHTSYRSDGDYISNNWKENPNGEEYIHRIEEGRPDLLSGASRLRSRVETVNRRFDKKYGWGNPEGNAESLKLSVQEQRLSDGRVAQPDGRQTKASNRIAGSLRRGKSTVVEVPLPKDKWFGKFVKDFVEGVLGKKIVMVKSLDKPFHFNGAIFPDDADTIYINADSTKPHMTVLGHELLHALRSDNPALYEEMRAVLEPMLENYGPYRNMLNEGRSRNNVGEASEELLIEEMIADLLGDGFSDPMFWNEVQKSQPALYERILTAITAYLDGVIEFLKGRGMMGTKYFRDYKKARNVAAKAFSDYVLVKQGKPAAGITITEEVVVEETGETVTVEDNAAALLRDYNDRMVALRQIQRCMAA